ALVLLRSPSGTPVQVGNVPTGSITPPPPAAFASGQPQAQALVTRVLSELGLPPGAVSTTVTPPAALGFPGTFIGGSTPSAVNQSVFWQVPGAPASTVAFVAGHLPRGVSGTTTAGPVQNHGSDEYEVNTTIVPAAGVADASLSAEAVAFGGGTMLRVDAAAEWYPARTPGEEVTAGDSVVVATEAPQGATEPAATVTVSDAPIVDRLANLFNALPTLPASGRPSLCPGDLAPGKTLISYTLSFGPAGGRDPHIEMTATCPFVAVFRLGGSGQAQAATLAETTAFEDAAQALFSAPSGPSPVPPDVATADAQALATAQLSSVVLPSGATLFTGTLPTLLQQAPTTPGAVDLEHAWTVPGSPSSVLAFVQAHLPAGDVISGGEVYMQTVSASYATLPSLPTGVQYLRLAYFVMVGSGHTSLLRVDAQVVPASP
ncbi:MAG: hypothetical protein ACRDJU_11770, partial [Actinomycetota bacterium]